MERVKISSTSIHYYFMASIIWRHFSQAVQSFWILLRFLQDPYKSVYKSYNNLIESKKFENIWFSS